MKSSTSKTNLYLSLIFTLALTVVLAGCEGFPQALGSPSLSGAALQHDDTNTDNGGAGSMGGANPPSPLSVLYAGSMTKVMEKKIGPSVRSELGVNFKGEGKGSTALAQMIRSGLAKPDVFISASPEVNTSLLMGKKNKNIVTWYLSLASDQLVFAYSPKSRFKQQLDEARRGAIPWYTVFGENGFQLGRTDPLLDPKGKKTIFLFELASKTYHRPNLKQKILGADENEKQVFPEESLLARLTSGQIDAVVAYKHEAVEWGVPYISLPGSINLGSAKYAKEYAQAVFKNAKGKISKGAPILFTITIPDTVANEKNAEAFVKYMLSGKGHDMLLQDGFTSVPVRTGGAKRAVPASLQPLVQGRMN